MVLFATGNVNKFNEARKVLAQYRIAVGMLRVKTLEIQSNNLEEIAKASVLNAFEKSRLPLMVEDAGLFIDALNGFPGPYAAYVYETIGNKGLLKLMRVVRNRKAKFQSALAYHSPELKEPKVFIGEVAGEIICTERRKSQDSGFGFDPVFKPLRSEKTFAEMDITEKNNFSHRAAALRKFAKWYKA